MRTTKRTLWTLAGALATTVAVAVPAFADRPGRGHDRDDDCEGHGRHSLPQGDEQVVLRPRDFTTTIDNPWFPMAPGTTWRYVETDAEGATQDVVVTVTDDTRVIVGIEARVVHDVVSEDGQVVEDTFDWYAQDRAGTVWYLGEHTEEYEDGVLVSTEGSWEHGVDGAEAGVLIPADPEEGCGYRQEFLAGVAEDQGFVLSVDEFVQLAVGSFPDVLTTRDTSGLEPWVLEHKFYALGVGPVLELDVSGGSSRVELVEVTHR